jgi:vitamin B12 transporter
MKIATTTLIILSPLLLVAQTAKRTAHFLKKDTTTLPAYEVTSLRLNLFDVGQNRLDMDSATLKINRNQNIADFLQNNTPLSIKAYGTGLSTVSMRGTGSSHTAIVWNGFSIQNALTGLVDLPLNEMGAFSHMSVKFGGGSALNGSGAMGGTIYIDSDLEKKLGFHGSVGANIGSYGLAGQQFQISTGTKKMTAGFRLSHQAANNNFEFRNTAAIGKPLQYITHAAYEKFNLNGSLLFNINPKNNLKIHVWDTRNDRQIAPTMIAQNDRATLRDGNSRLAAEYSHFGKTNSTKVRVAHFDDNNFYSSAVIDSSRNRVKTNIAELDHLIDFKGKKTLRMGLNMTHNTSLTNNFEKEYQRTRLAAFTSYNFEYLKTQFNINARQEMVDSRFVPFTFSTGFEKKLFKSLLPTANRLLILRGSLSRNYNLPALNDLYWAKLGNPNLVAENGYSGEMGVDYIDKQSKISVTAFAMRTKDWILWVPQTDGIWRPSNINTVVSRGVEVFYKTDFEKRGVKYRFNAQYQLAHSTDKEGYQLIYTPIHSGGASLRGALKHIFFQYNQTISSRRYATTDNTTWTDAFTLGNIIIGGSLPLKKCSVDMQVRVNNIFDTDYQMIPYYANPKRLLGGEVLLKF